MNNSIYSRLSMTAENCSLQRIHWAKPNRSVIARMASNQQSKIIRYLWGKYFPFGVLSCIAGDPATGKSTLLYDILAKATCGHSAVFVIIISTEDDFQSVIIPRLIAAGADLTKVINGKGLKFYPEKKMGVGYRPNDLEEYCLEFSQHHGKIGVIALDPLSQVVDGDSNNGSKARTTYEALTDFAERLDVVVLGISHLVKNSKGKAPLSRISGPGAIGQIPRFILMAVKNREIAADGGTHTLLHVKASNGKLQSGDSYSIVEYKYRNGEDEIETSKIKYHGVVEGPPEEIIRRIESDGEVDKTSAVEEAAKFLQEVLKEGAVVSKPVIVRLAKIAGISEASLNRAKPTLGILHRKQVGAGQSAPWEWYLPQPSTDEAVSEFAECDFK